MYRPFNLFQSHSHEERTEDIESPDKNAVLHVSQTCGRYSFDVIDLKPHPSTVKGHISSDDSDHVPCSLPILEKTNSILGEHATSEDDDHLSKPPNILDKTCCDEIVNMRRLGLESALGEFKTNAYYDFYLSTLLPCCPVKLKELFKKNGFWDVDYSFQSSEYFNMFIPKASIDWGFAFGMLDFKNYQHQSVSLILPSAKVGHKNAFHHFKLYNYGENSNAFAGEVLNNLHLLCTFCENVNTFCKVLVCRMLSEMPELMGKCDETVNIITFAKNDTHVAKTILKKSHTLEERLCVGIYSLETFRRYKYDSYIEEKAQN